MSEANDVDAVVICNFAQSVGNKCDKPSTVHSCGVATATDTGQQLSQAMGIGCPSAAITGCTSTWRNGRVARKPQSLIAYNDRIHGRA